MPGLDAGSDRIVLRPRFFDRECVVLLVLPAISALALVAKLLLQPPLPSTIHCERASGRCTWVFAGTFGTNTYHDDLAHFRASNIVESTSGVAWKVERTSKPLWLGNDTKDAEMIASYRAKSARLQAFLDDPSRPTYDASIPAHKLERFPLVFAGLAALLMLVSGLRWWRGWYAELELDPAQRTITIHRRPMFFTGPRTLTRAASELRLVEGVEKRYVGRGQSAKFAHFELRDTASGKRVFKYLAYYDAKNRAKLEADLSCLQQFFAAA